MLRKRTDEVSRLSMSFALILTSTWSSNDVQVKRNWSVSWVFAYRIKMCHVLARLAPSAISDRLEKWSGRFGKNLQEVISTTWNQSKAWRYYQKWKYINITTTQKYENNQKISKTGKNIEKHEKYQTHEKHQKYQNYENITVTQKIWKIAKTGKTQKILKI